MIKQAYEGYVQLLEPLPKDVLFETSVSRSTDLVQVFRDRAAIRSDGVVWVSWPKKASKVPTDVTDDTIRERALPLGFVDVKVCSVSDVWSALKLVVRKELR